MPAENTSFSLFCARLEEEIYLLEKNIKSTLEIFHQNKSDESTLYILRHALIISVYSFTEEAIRKLSENIAESTPFQKRVSRLDKIYQYYNFLINEMKLDRGRLEQDWVRLNIFRELRNCIVHHHSFIGKNISQEAFLYISENPEIHFEEPRTFRIKGDAPIMELLEVSGRFLIGLADECKKLRNGSEAL